MALEIIAWDTYIKNSWSPKLLQKEYKRYKGVHG